MKPDKWREKFLILSFSFIFYILNFTLACFAQDKIIAVVNNDVITQKDLDDFVNFMRIQLSAELKKRELEERIKMIKSDLLEKLIEDRLILQEAKKSAIMIDEARVRQRVDEIKSRYNSERDFQRDLLRQGLSQADIEARIKEQLLTYTIVKQKISDKILVSPEEVTEFYDNNRKEFISGAQRELEVVILENKELARTVFNNLKAGQTLDELIAKYPVIVDKIVAAEGGVLRKEIEEAVFRLEKGQVSNPLGIDDKFYVFRLINIIPPRQQTLAEVQERIHAYLYDKKMQDALSEWLNELKAKSYIKIL